MRKTILLAFLCFGLITGYEDKDIKCPSGQRLIEFTKSTQGKKKIDGKCGAFSPAVNDITCKIGKALKCDGKFEGCEDPNEWIGGFQIFDVDANLEMYVPYCCKSSKVRLNRSKCQQTPENTGNIKYEVEPAASMSRITCQYKTQSKDMIFQFEECNMAPNDGSSSTSTDPPRKENTPAKSIKTSGDNGDQISTNSPPSSGDPNLCFTRLVVKNKALDYQEDTAALNLITSINGVTDSKECAKKCYNAQKELNRPCKSFRFSGSTCSLRENYVNGGKVQILPAPIDVVYGNWTSPDCNGRGS